MKSTGIRGVFVYLENCIKYISNVQALYTSWMRELPLGFLQMQQKGLLVVTGFGSAF